MSFTRGAYASDVLGCRSVFADLCGVRGAKPHTIARLRKSQEHIEGFALGCRGEDQALAALLDRSAGHAMKQSARRMRTVRAVVSRNNRIPPKGA